MTLSRLLAGASAAACLLLGGTAHAQLDARAVPTYESVGLYWTNPGGTNPAAGCAVRFRVVGQSAYTQGLPLWYDTRNSECRGSLVHLAPNTSYEAELQVPGLVLPITRTVLFRTWASQVPVQRTINVPSGSATLDVNQGGTPLAYVVYQGEPGVLDANNGAAYNVTINASYVVVRGLTLRGAQQHAIRISPTVTDVIIEDNDIAGWGRSRGGGLGVNADSAVYAFCNAASTLTRLTIQRNAIHDPRYRSNSWSDGHPEGPQAITLEYCPGNHVIRHNDISSPSGRYFNDAISGSDNLSTTGFPNADSDIYGNRIANAWDDAIEAEGGNRNVRVWGNYMDRTGTGIASTVTSVGPLYLFRNVYNRSRLLEKVPPDQDDRQVMFKAGSDASLGNGRRYIFHNTMLQATEAGSVYGLGGSGGVSGTGSSKLLHNTVTRNNIWHLWRAWEAIYDEDTDNDFGWDMYNGNPGAPITNGIRATPTYAPGHGWQAEASGNYQLQAGTAGYDQGTRIANFNDTFLGAAPDIGAHEGGLGPMRFGIAASSGPAVNGAGPRVPTTPLGSLTVTPSALDFGGQSMGTRSPSQRVTVSNPSLVAVNVTGVATTAQFTQSNNCGNLAPGASCVVDVVFAPAPGPGPLNSRTAVNGSLTISSDDPGSPRNVGLSGVAEKSLVTHYYRTILRRAPDSAGQSFWEGEAARMAQLGANVNETWYALAMVFYGGSEYAALRRDDTGFVTDLYNTFFNRPPDSAGLGYWTDQLARGLPREVALAGFMFSPEFANFTRSIFGNSAVRAEVDMVVDFYRGLLSRLPDNGGFGYWVQRFRAAQCAGASAVYAEVESISSGFANGPEYANRGRSNAQFVGDLYNAYLRRGGDLDGVKFWIGQLDSGARTRDQVRQQFQSSPEFSNRVGAVVNQGC